MSRRCSRPNCDGPGVVKVGPRDFRCTACAAFAAPMPQNALEIASGSLMGRPAVQERASAPPESAPVILANGNQTGIDLSALFPNLTTDNIEQWRQQRQAEDDARYLRFLDETGDRQ